MRSTRDCMSGISGFGVLRNRGSMRLDDGGGYGGRWLIERLRGRWGEKSGRGGGCEGKYWSRLCRRIRDH